MWNYCAPKVTAFCSSRETGLPHSNKGNNVTHSDRFHQYKKVLSLTLVERILSGRDMFFLCYQHAHYDYQMKMQSFGTTTCNHLYWEACADGTNVYVERNL